jgi:hypothetical protein
MACATLQKQNPRAEARLQEANAALESLSAESTAFYGNLVPLLQNIRALYDHPGWSDMATTLAFTSRPDEWEDDASVHQGLQYALDDWTTKWGESGEDLFQHYRALVDRCSISEARRIGLIGSIASLQAAYLEVTFMELSADRYPQAEISYGTVEALSAAENELNSYALNTLGLYDVKPAP